MDLTGNPDGEPMRAGMPVSDIFTGVYSAVGILAALARREKTGRGGYVDTALVDTTVGVLANQALNYLVSGKVPRRMGNAHPNITPYQVFPVADGHIIIATRQRQPVRQAVRRSGRAGARQESRTISTTKRGWRTAPSWSARLCALTARISARRASAEARSRRRAGRTRSTISSRCLPIRRSSIAACALDRPSAAAKGGTIPGVRTPDHARRRADGGASALRRGSASTRPRFCARSARDSGQESVARSPGKDAAKAVHSPGGAGRKTYSGLKFIPA